MNDDEKMDELVKILKKPTIEKMDEIIAEEQTKFVKKTDDEWDQIVDKLLTDNGWQKEDFLVQTSGRMKSPKEILRMLRARTRRNGENNVLH